MIPAKLTKQQSKQIRAMALDGLPRLRLLGVGAGGLSAGGGRFADGSI